jgi:hypothetical protein
VKEPEVWVENRKRQREQKREIRAPLATIFRPALLRNTLSACWWIAGVMIVYYSINGLAPTGKRRLSTAHAKRGRMRPPSRYIQTSHTSLMLISNRSAWYPSIR